MCLLSVTLSTFINNRIFIVAAVDEIPILNIYYGINKKNTGNNIYMRIKT